MAPAPEARQGYQSVYLEGQLDRVTGVFTSFEKENERINGEWKEFRPTMAYRLRNVCLANGFLYKGAMKATLSPEKEKLIISADYEEIDQAFLTSTYCSNLYFGHFVYDELPATMLAESLGTPIMTKRQPYFHEPEYRDLFDLQARSVERAKIKEVVMTDDFPWNDFKVERIRKMRAKLREQLGAANPPGIYYRRGRSGASRFMVNEAEIEACLAKRGFAIADPQTQSATEMFKQGIGAEIVVGIEGSQMAPSLFSVKDGGAFLALQPPNRFNNHAKDRTDAMGLTYGFVIGLLEEEGFRIDVGELERTLDLLYAKIRPATV
ncbi:glycosyltransferase family 61 protein [Oscillatoria sp. CS-180]|uniref:glycosyltransferase 61 family protein n=1 Tax=Oscillatoria sp. CS-180 TaxID=3021720 RepID=UPI0023310847|nr:glycosyltransferase family 61 protein [Oscillatoria sp. CS-180]MDB9529192.1 glycosyltransferase family 61 protein [Oscillatoria sp. CS-180]